MNREFMLRAIAESQKAALSGEVPVGAVIVKDNKIIATGRNRREETNNALSHAEAEAIYEACRVLGTWRLEGCTLYVTLEPCPMCAGAILNSRISEVYFGAYDERYGSFGTAMRLHEAEGFSSPKITGGYMQRQCEAILKDFFETLRKKQEKK